MRTFREFITLCEQTYDKEMNPNCQKDRNWCKGGCREKENCTRKEKNESNWRW